MSTTAPKKRKADALNVFEAGDRCDAYFRDWSQFFPATVAACHSDGSYDVNYDDGYAEKDLPAKLLKAPKPFREGDKVEARFRGWSTFYPGTIVKVNDALYDVAYDDGYTEADVPRKFVRPRLEDAPQRAPAPVPTFEFAPGDRVAARYQGRRKRYAATVVAQRSDGTYDVAYDDGDAEGGVEPRLLANLATEVDIQAKDKAKDHVQAACELRLLVSASSFKPTKDFRKVEALCEAWGSQLQPTATSLLLLCACRPELTNIAKVLVTQCDAQPDEVQADGLSPQKVAQFANNERFLAAVGTSKNQKPAWVCLGTPCGSSFTATQAARRLLRRPSLGPEMVIAASDRSAARVVADALVLRHALGDAAEALGRSAVACAVAFDVTAVDAVEACRDAVTSFVDALPGSLHTRERTNAVQTITRRAQAVQDALGVAPKRPSRPRMWPAHCKPPGIFRADRDFAAVTAGPDTLRSKLSVRPVDANSLLSALDLEVVASIRIESGEAAQYAGVLGKANELATATKLSPRDQLAFWRFLISVDDDTVLLPFVDAETNPVCFINDAFGPARSSPDDIIWPNVRFQASGEGACVVALRRIEAGETIWIDYGDAFWAFRDDLDDVSRRLEDTGKVCAHLSNWASALTSLQSDAALPATLVKRLKGEFTVSQRALRADACVKGGRLSTPTSLSLARDALPRSGSVSPRLTSPRPPKKPRAPTPSPSPPRAAAAPPAWVADVRHLIDEINALCPSGGRSGDKICLEDCRAAMLRRGFVVTGPLPLKGGNCTIKVPRTYPFYYDVWGRHHTKPHAIYPYRVRSMTALLGYLEAALELAKDGVDVRLEPDTAKSPEDLVESEEEPAPKPKKPSTRAKAAASTKTRAPEEDHDDDDAATPPSVGDRENRVTADAAVDEAVDEARAKLLEFLEKTCGAPRDLLRRAARDVRVTAHRRKDNATTGWKGHLDYSYHLAGHPKLLRSRRGVAIVLGLRGDW